MSAILYAYELAVEKIERSINDKLATIGNKTSYFRDG